MQEPIRADEKTQTGPDSTPLPAASLPKGGGAIQGIGEKFVANPVTGTGTLQVPIATSPGRSGFGPQLSLAYDSGSGNGPFGFGWSLDLPVLSRKTEKGLPEYRDSEESDVFVLSDAEDLVPILNPDGTRFVDDTSHPGHVIHRYRPRIEGLFARIERWTDAASGEIHWRSITRDNVTTLYGKDESSRIFDPRPRRPGEPPRIFSWLACESYDDKGNAMLYEYAPETSDNVDRDRPSERNRQVGANRYLKRIKYGNRVSRLVQPDLALASWMFEVVFDYEDGHYEEIPLDPLRGEDEQHRFVRAAPEAAGAWPARPDPFSSYRPGFEVRTYRRCRRVLVFHRIPDLASGEPGYEGLVRSTEFDYADLDYAAPVSVENELSHQGSSRFASFLRSIRQSGYVRDDAQPPVVRNGVQFAAYLEKSLPPLEFEYSKGMIQDEVRGLDRESLENLPAGLDESTYRWVDLDGEGLSGMLTEQAGSWFYKPNLGQGKLGPLQPVAAQPSLATARPGSHQLLDLAGDGQLDVVMLAEPTPGFHERTAAGDWQPFRPFEELPALDWSDPNVRLVDLDGDGHADVLVTEQDVFTWHRSLAERGFGPGRRVNLPSDEELGPRLVFSDETQSVYLTDMCGDGLSDLVRIRNGEICYWPSLGHGRFGPKVTMDAAPWLDTPDGFDRRRIRLADVDGSGTTDVVYLRRDGADIYFNQSGNRWSEARRIDRFPELDELSSVSTADLLGNGTSCLVWSSPLPAHGESPLRYIDLTGGTKPHLLVKTVNNLGAETEIQYAPSTRFYLADKAAGKPWVTRLPFPVHVVERVVTSDRISRNRFVTRYAYHHGYFDGEEREFRGFGLVEQQDTEEIAALTADGLLAGSANLAAASHVPPVLTKTWFHTGAYLGRDHVSDYFAGLLDAADTGEYYREPGLGDAQARELLLEDTPLPGDLSAEEEREACRALKGRMLRQEVYALDGTDKEPHPYTVTEQNFTVRALQRRGGNRHAVFLAHPRESITHHYERVPSDPRTAHSLTLEVDDFGNILRSAEIAYGRRQPDPALLPSDRARQSEIHATLAINAVTNALDLTDGQRAPLPAEARSYELTGMALPAGRQRFTFDEVAGAAAAAADLGYEELPTAGTVQKRLIEHLRTYYLRDNLSGPLPLGVLQPLALPFETYKLALTPGLVAEVFAGRVTDAMLTDDARYVHTEGDADWWIPSGRVFYSPNPGDTPSQELAHARQHFFLPRRYRDPFHSPAASTESFVDYDLYDLLVQETRDALGNRVTVGERDPDPLQPPVRLHHDYRVLQPSLLMDPNRNRSAVAFDALGMVAGTAVMGKPEDNPFRGDRLTAAFRADLTAAEVAQFFANPDGPPASTLLDEASTRVVQDLDAYRREPDPLRKPPTYAATLARGTHASEPVPAGGVPIQVGFAYSDGFGREIQSKVQAEEGPVPLRDASGSIVLGPDGAPQMSAAASSPRWVGSGWSVFNNKGKPVRQYEPFFTDTHRFEFDVRIGVSPVLFYDPVERVAATFHPNHTWEKVVFDPWRQEAWDVNDTILVADPMTDPDAGDYAARLPISARLPTWHDLRTNPAHSAAAQQRWPDPRTRDAERRAAEKSALHAATPSVIHADSLGRTFLTIAHNRFKYGDSPAADPPVTELHSSRVVLDIEGNQREVLDSQGRLVMRLAYDMLGNRIHQASMEAGSRWILGDAAGRPVYAWDSRDHRIRSEYDALGRPTSSHLLDGAGPEQLVERHVYGDTQPNAEAANRRGRMAQRFDQSGVVENKEYDFKGNLLLSERQLAEAYDSLLDWSGNVPLQAESFTSRTRFDAFNRPVQMVVPHSTQPGANVNVVQMAYNEANLLEQVDAWLERAVEPVELLAPATADLHAVTAVEYDAKGQRTRLDRADRDGRLISTVYRHDPETFRLTSVYTRRGVDPQTGQGVAFAQDCENPSPPPPSIAAPEDPPEGVPCGLQNLHYTYDPAGNITSVRDDAQQTIHFRNRRVDPSSHYNYDALYRLIETTGREHLGQAGNAPGVHSYNDGRRIGLLSPSDGNAMGSYVERYVYDSVGNFLEMRHRGSDPAHPGWTRSYARNEPSQLEPGKQCNRLTGTTVGATDEIYSVAGDGYDAHGSLLRMPHLQTMVWSFRDQLRMTQRQAVDAADVEGTQRHGERTWYVYDSTGQRVRKVTESPGGQIREERVYLGGMEIYRRNGVNGLVRETLHVMDGTQSVALVETRTEGNEPGVPARLVRYQLGNHLGSASLELDDQARIISYEEYSPFGSTTYQAVRSVAEAPKRYRYTGKERDEENGFYYHGARYYAPWLGCWTAADPAGMVDGPNLYRYSRNSPVVLRDPRGLDPDDSEPVNLGPFQLGDFQLTGLSGGARIQFGLHGIGTDEPFSISVDSASLSGRLSLSSSFGIPSLGLEGGIATYQLDLQNVSIADERIRADLRGRARLESGPLSISFLNYANVSAHLDRRIVPGLWRSHLQRTLESASGSAEVFATPRLFNREIGFFALRAESSGGGTGTTSLSGRVGLGRLTLGRMQGTGTFSTGYFLDEGWVPGKFNLSGSFWAVGPGVAFGSWAFDMNRGLSASGHYFGTQFGPFGMNVGINPTGNVTDDTAYWRHQDAVTAGDSPLGQGAVEMYEPGTSFGYTFFHFNSTNRFLLSVGASPSSSIVPYFGGGASQPEIPVLGTLGVGQSPPDSGFYLGARLNWSFQSGWF